MGAITSTAKASRKVFQSEPPNQGAKCRGMLAGPVPVMPLAEDRANVMPATRPVLKNSLVVI